jgi:pilus assembly protein CpaC
MHKVPVCFLLLFLFSFVQLTASSDKISVREGGSKVLRFEKGVSVEAVDPNVAGATILSDDEIIVEGKKPGTTVITVTGRDSSESLLVDVLKAEKADSMIEVDVQILEISRINRSNTGIDWPALINGPLPDNGLPLLSLNAIEKSPPDFSILGSTFSRGKINILLDFLVTNNYARVLAKPKLLTSNGKSASFLSGGEVPVVTVSTQGQASVQWKSYGVNLEIDPKTNKTGAIEARIKAEVSNLDYSNSVNYGQGRIPAIMTRRAETNIDVEPGDTVVIAGLIENQESKVSSGVPVLSGIPLLGELFKTTDESCANSELVIFVTPKIAGAQTADAR